MYFHINYHPIFRYFIFQHQFGFFCMNMDANQYNNLQYILPKILEMNQFLNPFITPNTSLIAQQSKCISLQ